MAAGTERVPRDFLLLQLRRFPGAADEHPLPQCRRQGAGSRAHLERFRPGGGPHPGRHTGKLSASRWQCRHSRCIAALHGRQESHFKNLMRILVTNDDGIHSPGLAVAEKIARAISDDVWVVAPENEQSGASHSLTLTSPLRLRRIEERRFAVSGTPTDCVMMACLHILKAQPPELILSGVNWGSNLADDVTYSGTIAGAMEGCALGIPSIALSQCYDDEAREKIDWSAGAVHGPALIRKLVAAGWPKGTLININFP